MFQQEIFVVDNGSKDGTKRIIEAFRRRSTHPMTAIYLQKNRGTTYSRNLALKRAKGKFIVIMDSDIQITHGALETLIEVIDGDANIGLVAPKLIYPNGKIQKSTDRFPTVGSKLKRFFLLRQIERSMLQNPGRQTVDYAISAFWVLRKSMLEKVGYLDENIFVAPEDADYCLNIWRQGHRIIYIPDAVAIHKAQELSRGIGMNKAKYEHLRGLYYYFKKHNYWFFAPKPRCAWRA